MFSHELESLEIQRQIKLCGKILKSILKRLKNQEYLYKKSALDKKLSQKILGQEKPIYVKPTWEPVNY